MKTRTINQKYLPVFSHLVRNGRVVVQPIFKGTYDRADPKRDSLIFSGGEFSMGTMFRDNQIKRVQDLSRTIDYLETRQEIDAERLGYIGLSWGGAYAAIVLAVENRIDAAVVNSGGFWNFKPLPEGDQLNFAPRVRAPILMLNGKYDLTFPLETSQKPMFELLGTDPQHKKFISIDSAHFTPRNIHIRESMDWFDRYLDKPGREK